MNVIIVHGAYGYPEENWFSWLKNQLTEIGIHCQVPQLPTPQEQTLNNWINVFNNFCKSLITAETILIGHSLGAAFILRWLERYEIELETVILVGAFTGTVGCENFDLLNQSFFSEPFDWVKIKHCSRQFVCYHGDNDPYVTFNNFNNIANKLEAKRIIIHNAGHFNIQSGYQMFPQLFQYIRDSIKHRV